MPAARHHRRRRHADPTPWYSRSAFGRGRGLPAWGAIHLAVGVTTVGGVVDMLMHHGHGWLFPAAYMFGCVGSACWIRRRHVFTAMVQPPYILASAACATVLVSLPFYSGRGGLLSLAVALAIPLITNFPAMAATTALTTLIAVLRLVMQRPPRTFRSATT